MKITIYGAGAMGGSLGAYLVQAGEDVLFVDNNREHVREITANGLHIEGIRGEFLVRARALVPEQLHEELDVVLLSVKSQHTEEAVRQLRKFLTPSSVVVSLQNGINEDSIAQLIGKERTIGSFINWAADYIGPGRILLGGEGCFFIGELDGAISERLEGLQKKLSALFPVQVTSNIMGYLWSKQVNLSVLFATGLTNDPIHEVVLIPGYHFLFGALAREAMQVPEALGVTLEAYDEYDPVLYKNFRDMEGMEKIAVQYRHNIKNRTGLWRDIAVRKRKSEIDDTLGVTVSRGKELGLSLPLNTRLIQLVHELEDEKRIMSTKNIEDLKEAMQR